MPLPFIIAGLAVAGSLLAVKASAATIFAANEYKNRKGYRSDEGPLSPRADVLGILIAENSNSRAGRLIALCKSYRPELQQFEGLLLEATESEGQDLERLLKPVEDMLVAVPALKEQITEAMRERAWLCEEPETMTDEMKTRASQLYLTVITAEPMLKSIEFNITNTLDNVVLWLERFPRKTKPSELVTRALTQAA